MERQDVGVQLYIPTFVAWAIRLPEKRIVQNLLEELAVALYVQELLSFGKARELAGYWGSEASRATMAGKNSMTI